MRPPPSPLHPDVITARNRQQQMRDALEAADRHRQERDAAIVRLGRAGLSAGAIHRALGTIDGLSVSNITHILRCALGRRSHR